MKFFKNNHVNLAVQESFNIYTLLYSNIFDIILIKYISLSYYTNIYVIKGKIDNLSMFQNIKCNITE